jgi:very-short-patch-repair endonuclease
VDIRWTRARRLRNASTDAERRLWNQLKGRRFLDVKFRRQYPVGPYVVDFVCCELGLVVELDGGQHGETERYDARRTIALERRGYRVIRFWNNEVMRRVDDVLDELRRVVAWRQLEMTPPQPSPAEQGRGRASATS